MATELFDKKVFQVIHAHGIIEASKLVELLEKIDPSFDSSGQAVKDMFKRINGKIRAFSLEIKSVVQFEDGEDDGSAGARSIFHGIVNTEDDHNSKEFGSDFSAQELKFVSAILEKLLEQKFLSSQELIDLCPVNVFNGNAQLASNFLAKLQGQCWLQRDPHNNWIIGSRSFLELRGFLESVITPGVDGEDLDAATQQEIQEELARLPQILMY